MGNPKTCPHESGHGSLKGRSTVREATQRLWLAGAGRPKGGASGEDGLSFARGRTWGVIRGKGSSKRRTNGGSASIQTNRLDGLPFSGLAAHQKRRRQRSVAADLKRTEILVPIAFRHLGMRINPVAKTIEIGDADR